MNTETEIFFAFLLSRARYRGLHHFYSKVHNRMNGRKDVINTIDYLKKRKYALFEGDSVKLTAAGRQFLKRRQARLRIFDSPFPRYARKDLLLLFDIPESRKAEREWFRRQLKTFGYTMIQKSAWIGPSPLPKEFVSYIKSIKLEKGIKTFRLATKYKHKKSTA